MEVCAYGFTIAGILLEQPAIAALSLGCLSIYGVTVFTSCNDWKQAETAERYADRLYFIAYLCTIMGFMGIGFTVAHKPELLKEPMQLLFFFAIALGSTLVGLFSMNRLKSKAEDLATAKPDFEHDPVERITQFFNAFETRLKEFFDTFEDHLKKSELARIETMMKVFNASDFGKTLNRIAIDLKTGSESLDELRHASDASRELIVSLTNTLAGLNKQIKELSDSYSRSSSQLDGLLETSENITKLHQSITVLGIHLSSSAGALANFNEGVGLSNKLTSEFARNVDELQSVIEEYVKLTKIRLQDQLK